MGRHRVNARLGWVLVAAAVAGTVETVAPTAARGADGRVLRNDDYTLGVGADGAVTVTAEGVAGARVFRPAFTVLSRETDPKVALRPSGVKGVSYNVPTWDIGKKAAGAATDKLGKVDTKVSAGDGFDNSILEGAQDGRTPDLFRAAAVTQITGTGAEVSGGLVRWILPGPAGFELNAELRLPAGRGEPRVAVTFVAREGGWYSVGYTGAPAGEAKAVEEIWQPLIWTEKRFPDRSYLTAAFHCPVPAPMVTAGGATYGLVVDPAEIPFQPLPTFANSRFGVLVRNAAGKAQPMAFAPVLGGPGSRMKAGEKLEFNFRLMVRAGTCMDAQEYVAREVYGFKDRRENGTHTLNQTLENMVAYGMSEWSRFNEDLRGCAYDTDAPGTVKNVSALHPLSLAVVTDDEGIYVRRGRPIVEFLLSREKFLFATNKDVKTQNPGWRLLGPCAPLSELAALHLMTGGRNPMLADQAEAMLGQDRTLNLDEKQDGKRWPNYLAVYRATGRAEFLAAAKAGADKYVRQRVDTRQESFRDPMAGGMFFWSSFAPMWVDLLELYEETGEKRYLDAARAGARRYCQYVWACPAVPDESITVNEGGVAPEYWYLKARGNGPIKVAEETVPAWRVSEIGLLSESSGTSSGHRGVFMANHAPWMLRLARLTGDQYLHDVARWAVVGRYANFPGYHINTARTTVYEKPEYPLRPFKDLTYNSFHFNHIWPHVALVMDYLVSDAYYRSNGQVDFPGRYAEGYAYLKSKVYGDRPGTFYGVQDAWLWMPKGLVTVDNVQVNYLAARGADGGLFVALCNQSAEPVTVTARLDGKLVAVPTGTRAKTWVDNASSEKVAVDGGTFTVKVSGRGITAVAIPDAVAKAGFQAKVTEKGPGLPAKGSVARVDDVGGVRGMLLSMGPDLTHAYVYSQATYEQLKGATLNYRTDGGEWKRAGDDVYPYEFTVPLESSRKTFEFYIEGAGVDGKVNKSATAALSR